MLNGSCNFLEFWVPIDKMFQFRFIDLARSIVLQFLFILQKIFFLSSVVSHIYQCPFPLCVSGAQLFLKWTYTNICDFFITIVNNSFLRHAVSYLSFFLAKIISFSFIFFFNLSSDTEFNSIHFLYVFVRQYLKRTIKYM